MSVQALVALKGRADFHMIYRNWSAIYTLYIHQTICKLNGYITFIFASKNGHYFCMQTLADKRTQGPTLFREWFSNSQANRHEICTRLIQRVKIKVSRILSESVKFHSVKLTMMFKLNFEKKYVRRLKTSVQNGLMPKVNITFLGNDHWDTLHKFTKNCANWMKTSCWFLRLKKSAITFGEGFTLTMVETKCNIIEEHYISIART